MLERGFHYFDSPENDDDNVAARLHKSEEPRVMSVNQAAVYICRTPNALRHMIASGTVPIVREGSRLHLDRADLDQWIEMRKGKS